MQYKKLDTEPGSGKATLYRTSNDGQWGHAEYLCPFENVWLKSFLWRNGDLPRNPDQFEPILVEVAQ